MTEKEAFRIIKTCKWTFISLAVNDAKHAIEFWTECHKSVVSVLLALAVTDNISGEKYKLLVQCVENQWAQLFEEYCKKHL